MRKSKKIVSLIITLAFVLSLAVPVGFAADSMPTDAQGTQYEDAFSKLYDLSIFQGSDVGFEPNKVFTRAEFVAIAVRIAGKEDAAALAKGPTVFGDVAGSHWASGYFNVAYNLGILKGDPADAKGVINARPSDTVTTAEVVAMLVRALGFDSLTAGKPWPTGYMEVGVAKGLVSEGANAKAEVIRGQAAIMAEAAVYDVENADGSTIAEDVFGIELAVASAKAVDATNVEVTFNNGATQTFTVDQLPINQEATRTVSYDGKSFDVKVTYAVDVTTATAAQTGVKKVEVTFSEAVTADAAFSLKRGTIVQSIKTVTWNEAKTVATLETYIDLGANDFTVSVTGVETDPVTATFKAAAGKVSSISFTTDLIKTAVSTADVKVKVANQFGEDITTASAVDVWDSLNNAKTPAVVGPTVTITKPAAGVLAVDDLVVVTAIDPGTGVSASKTFKVVAEAKPDTVTFTSGLTNKDSKVLRLGTVLATDKFYFNVDAFDQYGNKITTAATLNDATKVTVAASAGVTTIFVYNATAKQMTLELTAVGATAGAKSITVVANLSGKASATSFTVAENVALAGLTMQPPATQAIAAEAIDIPFTAADQFGGALTKYADINGLVNFTTVNAAAAIVKNALDGTAILRVTPAAKGTVVITSVVPAKGQTSQITFTAADVAVPTNIVALKDATLNLVNSSTATLNKDNFDVRDQYDRTIALGTRTIAISASDGTADTVTATVGPVDAAGTAVTLTGSATKGTEVFKAELMNGAAVVSTIEFSAATIDKGDIATYEVKSLGTMFATGAAYGAASNEQKAYAKTIDIYGLTSSGAKVALAAADIMNVASNNANVDLASAAGKAYVANLTGSNTSETASIIATIQGKDGIITASTEVTLTKAARTGGTVAVKGTKGSYVSFADGVAVMTTANVDLLNTKIASSHGQYVAAGRAAVYFEILDQYGIASAAVAPVYYSIAVKDAAGKASTDVAYAGGAYAINATTGVISAAGAVAGDEITITAVTSGGTVSTVKVIAQ